jgi:flavorubredoxin
METKIHEIADGIYRLSTLVPEVAPPAGFTFNQFLIKADEPLLFHCGHRAMFPAIAAAVARIMPVERLRWLSFSHVEADESGAMNQWLAAAPRASVLHGPIGVDVSLNDLADRPPRKVEDGERVDLGGKRVRFLATPHVPHGWDAGLLFEETTRTLFASDLLGQVGDGPATTDGDIVGPAIAAEGLFQSMALHPVTVPTLNRLADLEPRTLAIMHGSSLTANGAAALRALADDCALRQRGIQALAA